MATFSFLVLVDDVSVLPKNKSIMFHSNEGLSFLIKPHPATSKVTPFKSLVLIESSTGKQIGLIKFVY